MSCFITRPAPAVTARTAAKLSSQFSAEPGYSSHGKPGRRFFRNLRERELGREQDFNIRTWELRTADLTTLEILSGVRDFLSPVNMSTGNKIRRWGRTGRANIIIADLDIPGKQFKGSHCVKLTHLLQSIKYSDLKTRRVCLRDDNVIKV